MTLVKSFLWIAILLLSNITSAEELATDAVFKANSFWYTPIPQDVVLNVNSANFVDEFLRQKKTYYGTIAVNYSYSFSSPVYIADANTHTTAVAHWDCAKNGKIPNELLQQMSEVPIPDYAVPAEGTDAEMSIYQPSTDTLWEFWNTRKVNGQWQICWGGRMQNVSKSDGIFPGYFGTTATSLPFIGGQITAEELERGEIKHVIGIALVDLEDAKIFSWPAHRSDGRNPHGVSNRIPEGSRFRLDPSVDVDALKMHPIGKIIAKAAQKYGFVVWDKAGAIVIRVQNPYSYTALGQPNPYDTLFDGAKGWQILQGFPWERLQFLPMDYGKP